jgi:ribosomal protein L37E
MERREPSFGSPAPLDNEKTAEVPQRAATGPITQPKMMADGMVSCRGCGKQLHRTATMCPHCGAPQGEEKAPRASNKMRASHVALVILACLGSAFSGGLMAGFVGALTGSAALGVFLLSIPSVLIAAHFAGKWIARRKNPPGKRELVAGAVIYILLCILLAFGSKHPAGIVFAVIGGGGIGFLLVRAALASLVIRKIADAG